MTEEEQRLDDVAWMRASFEREGFKCKNHEFGHEDEPTTPCEWEWVGNQ